jgi:two-component system, NarL family, sensor kinase
MSDQHITQIERRNRELSILNRIAGALNQEVDLKQALNAALAQVAELLDLQTGWVFLIDEETDRFYTAATQNLPPALGRNPRRMGGTCYCLDTFRDGDMQGAANVNVITCTRLENLVDGTDGLRYHASIPLRAHGKQLGVLNVASRDWRELSPDDLRLLYTVGDLLSMAIERARLFTRSVQYGAAEERNRLAREIHDTLAQQLAGIVLQLETADALLETGDRAGRVHDIVRQTLALTRESLDEARRSVLDLRAAPLEGRTLADALETLAAEIGEKYGDLTIDCEIVGGGHPLPSRVEIGLYRIAQEAITNIIRHAGAERASIHLAIMPEGVQLVVNDDGCGFDPERIPGGHFGLSGMKERVKLLGGELAIRSTPRVGTQIRAVIPLGKTS